MVFYSVLKIIKTILFGLKGVLKYLFYSLLVVAFIGICLLLMGSNVFAYEGTAFTDYDMEGILTALDSVKGNYDSFTISLWYNGYNGVMINCFNKSDDLKIYYKDGKLKSNIVVSGRWNRYEGDRIVSSGNYNTIMENDVGMYGGEYYFYSNLPFYAQNLTDILWEPPSVIPTVYPYLNNTTATLSTGEFTYFVVEPRCHT